MQCGIGNSVGVWARVHRIIHVSRTIVEDVYRTHITPFVITFTYYFIKPSHFFEPPRAMSPWSNVKVSVGLGAQPE